jgi:hypothetical protein
MWLYVKLLFVHLMLRLVTEKREGKGAVLTVAHRYGHKGCGRNAAHIGHT